MRGFAHESHNIRRLYCSAYKPACVAEELSYRIRKIEISSESEKLRFPLRHVTLQGIGVVRSVGGGTVEEKRGRRAVQMREG